MENEKLPKHWRGLLKQKQQELVESLGKGMDKVLQPLVPKPENYNPETDSYDMDYLEEGAYAQPKRTPARPLRGLAKEPKA